MPEPEQSTKETPDTCADAVEHARDGTAGIVQVAVDLEDGQLELVYDEEKLSPAAAERMARRMAAAVEETHASCTVRLGQQGGRSCESCALALENRLRHLPGVKHASASYRSGVLRVDYDARQTSPEHVVRIVREFGVPTADPDAEEAGPPGAAYATRQEAVFTVLTFAGMMTGLISDWLDGPALLSGVAYTVAYFFGGWYGVKGSIEALRHRTVDIDLLMILAAIGALVVGAPFEGAMLLFLFSLSNVLQHYAIGRSRRAIEALVELRPDTATVRRDGRERAVPLEEVEIGDVFILRPGDRVPLDGRVLNGESVLNEASLTGESVPVEKGPDAEVYAGTINETGSLEVRVTKRVHESTLARLIDLVEKAQSEKAATQRLIDRLEQPYAFGVLAMTAIAIVLPNLWGEAFDTAFYRAMTLMVAASPCAVIISTPAAVLSAIANAARRGVLFKGGAYVEAAGRVRAVAFDKTGTLTQGKTELTAVGVRSKTGLDEDEVLALAAAVQARSEHHLAGATVEAARERGLVVPEASGFRAVVGRGVRAGVEGATLHIGNPRYFDGKAFHGQSVEGLEEGLDAVEHHQKKGETSVLVVREVGEEKTVLGWLAFADQLRPEAPAMVASLRRLGVEHIVMLTGDNEHVAQAIAQEAGIDVVYAELLPGRKVDVVRELNQRYGSVAMVGDGVNDAPALAAATVGIAMGGAGTDVALETADLVLMADDLSQLPYALSLSRSTRRTLTANLVIAFAFIFLMVATILFRGLPLPLAVVGHEGSTVLVSLNGLRLLGFRGRGLDE